MWAAETKKNKCPVLQKARCIPREEEGVAPRSFERQPPPRLVTRWRVFTRVAPFYKLPCEWLLYLIRSELLWSEPPYTTCYFTSRYDFCINGDLMPDYLRHSRFMGVSPRQNLISNVAWLGSRRLVRPARASSQPSLCSAASPPPSYSRLPSLSIRHAYLLIMLPRMMCGAKLA